MPSFSPSTSTPLRARQAARNWPGVWSTKPFVTPAVSLRTAIRPGGESRDAGAGLPSAGTDERQSAATSDWLSTPAAAGLAGAAVALVAPEEPPPQPPATSASPIRLALLQVAARVRRIAPIAPPAEPLRISPSARGPG